MPRRGSRVAFALAVSLATGCQGGSGANRIPAIQGPAHRSPLEGGRLRGITGVVTAVRDAPGRHGFWLQDPDGDRDPATSDALFVLTGQLPPSVAPGDRVLVSGRVEEDSFSVAELSTTRLAADTVEVMDRGWPLPGPVRLGAEGRPVPAGVSDDGLARFEPSTSAVDFWESLEGMRVVVHRPLVVGPTSGYGGLALLPDGGEGYGPRTSVGGVLLTVGASAPPVILVDARAGGRAPAAAVGDRLAGSVVGVVDYAFGVYQLRVTEPLPEVRRQERGRASARLRRGPGSWTVATYNVLNLSVAGSGERVGRLAESIVHDLGSPDVVALQEVQDDSGPEDDGVVEATRTLQALVDGVAARGGPRYRWRQVDPRDGRDGGQPGGNIRVVFLHDPQRTSFRPRGAAGPTDPVEVEGVGDGPRLSLNPGRITPLDPCFENDGSEEGGSRKPLVVELEILGRRVFLVNNHWTSKRGDDPVFGARQPPRRESEKSRTCQAERVAAFVEAILGRDPQAAVVVLGDLNEHEFRPPLVPLQRVGLVNLADRVPAAERYTYNYRGVSQVLDHVLVSPALAAGAEVEVVHVNADLPASESVSDHDPVVARFRR